MMLSCHIAPVERAQPWLGTLVTMRAYGTDHAAVHHAVGQAFAEIRTVHQLMSFHSPQSDVSELNRSASKRAVAVHPFTHEVLSRALALSAASDGCFDTTVAAELVKTGLLPEPAPDGETPEGNWRDIEILPDGRVRFGRPLWIDFGGIAKGFAVDRAVACLQKLGVQQGLVNAGGDLRVFGPRPELVALRIDGNSDLASAAIELSDGSAASSSGFLDRRRIGATWRGPHLHGGTRAPASTDRFACVLAKECLLADALTKVVLVLGERSRTLLGQLGATAHLFDPSTGWMHLNAGCAR